MEFGVGYFLKKLFSKEKPLFLNMASTISLLKDLASKDINGNENPLMFCL